MIALYASIDSVFLLEWLALSAIFGVGIYASYTDIHQRLIRNYGTWGLLALGLGVQLGLWRLGETDLVQLSLTVLVGLGLAVFFYVQGFWSPGDAKLYWGMVVAFPPTLLKELSLLSLDGPVGAVAVNALLVNAFVLIGVLLAQKGRRSPRSAAESWIVQGGWLIVELGGLLGWVMGIRSWVWKVPFTFMEILGLVVVLSLLTDRFIPRTYRPLFALPGWGVALYLVRVGNLPLRLGLLLLLASWAILMGYWLVRHRFGSGFISTVAIARLRPGMAPTAAIQPAASPEKQHPRYVLSHKIHSQALCQPGQPLDAEDVGRLQVLNRQGVFRSFGGQLEVEEDLPFAPFLVVGVLITVLLAGTPGRLLVSLVTWVDF